MTLGILLVALLIILIGAETFTNALEHLGERLKISEGVTGSIFAVRVRGTAVVVSVDDRDYSFDRLSGRFLGTGYATRSSYCRSDLAR